jgi:putative sigma-54 modulation protein
MTGKPPVFAFVGENAFRYNHLFGKKPAIFPARTKGVVSVHIRISARHGSLSDETQAKIRAKVEKLTRLFERLTEIEVTVDLERRDAPVVDLRVSAEHKRDFVASHGSNDLLGSVDQVIHKLEQQLRKYKEKIQDRHRVAGNRPQQVGDEPEN